MRLSPAMGLAQAPQSARADRPRVSGAYCRLMPILTYKGRKIRLTPRMIEILEYATRYPQPRSWHNIGRDEASGKAIARLEAAGLVEVAEHSQQYRLTP
jgi:hypothetical protein